MSNAEKLKALKLTMDKIDKDFGKGSVMMMNERSQEPMEVISTGSIGLDMALGVGGLPNLPARPLSLLILLQRPRKRTACVRSSTRSMHLTALMRKSWE
jgi:hypothetical protein